MSDIEWRKRILQIVLVGLLVLLGATVWSQINQKKALDKVDMDFCIDKYVDSYDYSYTEATARCEREG